MLEKYREEGNQVIMGGDFNAWTGEAFGMAGNDPKMSPGGKELIKLMVEGEWSMMNSKSQDDPRTHLDRTSGTQRCLDYLISFIYQSFATTFWLRLNMTPLNVEINKICW